MGQKNVSLFGSEILFAKLKFDILVVVLRLFLADLVIPKAGSLLPAVRYLSLRLSWFSVSSLLYIFVIKYLRKLHPY